MHRVFRTGLNWEGVSPPLPPLKTALLAVVIALLHFCFNFILFGRTGQVNFHFN